MSYQKSVWNEQQAEELVTEFMERESLPNGVVREATDYMEQGEPVRALELVMESRSRTRAADD